MIHSAAFAVQITLSHLLSCLCLGPELQYAGIEPILKAIAL